MQSQPEQSSQMSRFELRASASLASLSGLRMMGLFLILPVFAVHAAQLRGGENMTLVGLALGAYGLTQAALHLVFGMASDRYGRKRLIVLGLIMLAAGSFLAASATDIYWTIVGRALQGAGAISAVVVAFVADVTREEHRTKAMAIIGMSIGFAFAVSLVTAPTLYQLIGMSGIFAFTGALAIAGIWVTLQLVPPEPAEHRVAIKQLPRKRLREIASDRELLRLNCGIFTLHLTQMAMFVVVPHALIQYGGLPVTEHWKVYLPVVIGSFILMVPPIIAAERRGHLKAVFLSAIGLLALAEFGFAGFGKSFVAIVGLLLAFFVAFNILEASLPSLVSKIAPPESKGTAMGVYNTSQALGLFVGAVVGGFLAQHVGYYSVFLFCAVLMLIWVALASTMKAVPRVKTQMFHVGAMLASEAEKLAGQLAIFAGVEAVTVLHEEGTVMLKVSQTGWDEEGIAHLLKRGDT